MLNVNRGFTGDVVDSYLDKILCKYWNDDFSSIVILSQVKCITNSQNVDYINGFISTIISLKNRIMTQPELQQQISLIREYYQLVSDLVSCMNVLNNWIVKWLCCSTWYGYE